jgi:hypothetical protein
VVRYYAEVVGEIERVFDPHHRSLGPSSRMTTTSRRRTKAKARLVPSVNGTIDLSASASSVGTLLLVVIPSGIETPSFLFRSSFITPSSLYRSSFIMHRAVQPFQAAGSPFSHLLFHCETTLDLITITQKRYATRLVRKKGRTLSRRQVCSLMIATVSPKLGDDK